MANPLGSLFGRSPIRPIQQHMEKAHSCTTLLLEFYAATISEHWDEAKKLQQKIQSAENEADIIKRDIRLNLPSSLMLPVPRTDILDLLTIQDMLANISKDVAGLMLGRKMIMPSSIAKNMNEYIQASVDASAQALKAINELDELVETGFRGKEVDLINTLVKELDKIEHHNDELQVDLRAELFKLEGDLPPVDVMFFYKVIDRVGDLADYAQRVGHRLTLLIAK